jgi:aspartate racemase
MRSTRGIACFLEYGEPEESPMHKRIGILGGMSPESTVEYYQYITRSYTARFGDYGYPEVLIYSVSFQPYVEWPAQERWDLVAEGLGKAGRHLEAAGADFLLIATNTMHLVVDQVRAAVSIPVLSLLDVVADACQAQGFDTVGLLGTRFTMEKSFYQDALARKGLVVLVPDAADRVLVNQVIYEELVAGDVRTASREAFVLVIQRLAARGAEAVILGCTEIPLLVREGDVDLPLLDTTVLHAQAALEYALGK